MLLGFLLALPAGKSMKSYVEAEHKEVSHGSFGESANVDSRSSSSAPPPIPTAEYRAIWNRKIKSEDPLPVPVLVPTSNQKELKMKTLCDEEEVRTNLKGTFDAYPERNVVILRNEFDTKIIDMAMKAKKYAESKKWYFQPKPTKLSTPCKRYFLLGVPQNRLDERVHEILERAVAKEALNNNGIDAPKHQVKIKNIRIHEYTKQGEDIYWHNDSKPREHCRSGDIPNDNYVNYTMLVMLSDVFKGGEFRTAFVNERESSELSSKVESSELHFADLSKKAPEDDQFDSIRQHVLKKGDAIVFNAETYHSVLPMIAGVREVLVVHFWEYERGLPDESSHGNLLLERTPHELYPPLSEKHRGR